MLQPNDIISTMPSNTTATFSANHAIDDNDVDTDKQQIFHDNANNFTFTVTRKNGTAYISPLETHGLTELKIGVLLPFHQKDNEWTKTITLSGASAIRMAVAEINTRGLIPGAYITLIEQDSYPKEVQGQAAITQAIYSTVSLVHEGVIAVIGDISSSWTSLSALMTSTLGLPQCSFSAVATALSDKAQYSYFFRTIPTDLIYADAALSFISSQKWNTIGVLYSGDDFGKQLSKDIIMKARDHNIIIKGYQSFFDNDPASDIQKSIDTLMKTGARVIFVAATNDAPLAALITAAHSGYINKDNVWLTIGVDSNALYQSVTNFNNMLSTRANNSNGISSVNKGNSSGLDPLAQMAQTTQNLTPVEYNSSFSGGVFAFETISSLPGYGPFDQFLQKWASLDPSLYPYGGQMNISGNEGYAYSCMMAIAEGFHNIVKNSINATTTLNQLAYRQLGTPLSTSAFNTSYVGPEGPVNLDENGDTSIGNYHIYNIQKGVNVNIGNIVAGQLNLTSPPIYYDGTTNVPTGVPPKVSLNPGYSTPLSIILAVVSATGTLLVIISMCLVLAYRKRPVFQMASPLFCILELIGFILCYTSVLFFIGDKSTLSCTVFPVTLNLGWSLVLGSIIAKNYRIYRVFNNIFITRTLVGNRQLLKTSGGILLVEMVILALWLCLCHPQTVTVPMTGDSYYVDCFYNGPLSDSFVTLLTFVGACELALAALLVFKTKSVGKNYSKYSEYKQIGLSVYNIVFSALIGIVAFFLPITDYYTQHFLVATMVVWATTFCLFALFLPKFLRLRKPAQDTYQVKNKISDLPGRQQSFALAGDMKDESNLQRQKQQQSFGELLSMNGVLNGGNVHQYGHQNSYCNQPKHPQYQLQHRQLYHRTCTASGKKRQHDGALLDAYEAQLPIQRVLKYLPFLSSWSMQQLVLIPRKAYFSHVSENAKKGNVFGYSHATIVSTSKESYVLKVHGRRFHDILIQMANEDDLQQWYKWFNSTSDSTSANHRHKGNQQRRSFFLGSRHSDVSNGLSNTTLGKVLSSTAFNKPINDSGMTTQHLLATDDDGISNKMDGSCITLATFGTHTSHMAETDANATKTTIIESITTAAANPEEGHLRQNQPSSSLQIRRLSGPRTSSLDDRTIVETSCISDGDAIMMNDL